MKAKIVIQIVLGVVIIALALLIYNSIMTPVRFENEYNKRREACAEKLKAIRTLEDAYKQTYGCYMGSFDTLIGRLMTEDSMKTVIKITNYDKIPADVDINEITEKEALEKGYKSQQEAYINPIAKLREDGKLPTIDATGHTVQMSDDQIRNLRYVPYPKDKKYEFELNAGMIDKSGFMVPVFECKVPLSLLLEDMDKQQVTNKIASVEKVVGRYAGWKVGDMTQAVTDGNFE